LVTGKHLDENHHPSLGLKILSVSGIIFLIGFATIFAMLKLNFFLL
jgi:hypothetical protein